MLFHDVKIVNFHILGYFFLYGDITWHFIKEKSKQKKKEGM